MANDRTVHSLAAGVPANTLVGNLTPGTGPARPIAMRELAEAVVATGVVAGPGGPANLPLIANNRVLGNTSGATAAPTAQALTQPAAGLTITGGTNAFTFALANDLAGVEGLATNGLAARTATSTWTTRTITGTASRLSVTNGDGVSGNPTLDIDAAYVGQASITTLGTIATGTWAGTTIAVNHGGTGQTSYTDGQLLIGNSSGNTLSKATLTAGSGVTITNGSGTITIATSAGGDAIPAGLYNQVMTAAPTSAGVGFSTWLNQGGASVADTSVGVSLTLPSNASAQNVRGRYFAVPATPYTITALVAMTPLSPAQFTSMGIGWYDGTNKVQLIDLQQSTTSPSPLVFVSNYATPSSVPTHNFSGSASSAGYLAWFQIADDGTTVSFRWSADGTNFKTVYSVAKASGALGATGYSNILFGGNAFNTDTFGTLLSWSVNNAGQGGNGLVRLQFGGTGANLSATGGTSQFLKQASAGAVITVVQPTFADIASGSTAATATGLTISGGTLSGNTTLPGSGLLDSSGNLGLGGTPSTDLHVISSNANPYSASLLSSGPRSNFQNSSTTDGNSYRHCFTTIDTLGAEIAAAGISAIFVSHTASAVSGGIAFQTRNAGTVGERGRFYFGGDFRQGSGTALATTVTDGFLLISTCAGPPTGVPTNAGGGQIPLVWDKTNLQLYAYSGGAWKKSAAFT